MKRRLLILAALVLALAGQAALASGRSYIPHDCGQFPCVCFIQRGDEGGCVKGIVERLQQQGYLPPDTPTGLFSEEVEAAVMAFQGDNGLPRTGTMDDDTLTLLIWGMLPEELDAAKPLRIGDPLTYTGTVFIPTDGGERRHRNANCCDMYDPRKVSIRNAHALGFLPCRLCHPS